MSVLISAQDLTKSYGPRPLFSGLGFDLRVGERVGLIGPNGSGKSTLMRILAGLEETDEGILSIRRSARIGYLPQDDVFEPGKTVREVLIDALEDEPIEEHERETRSAIQLTQMKFDDPNQPVDVLSGGWKKRLALARELIREPELLLLDEPTNHLDLPGILWLERLLREATFGYLVASHDRAFLRAVADEVMEINRVFPGGSFRAPGTYEQFCERRLEFLQSQAKQEEAVANRVRRETEWLGRQAAARTTKASSRIDAASQRRDELEELKYRNAESRSAGIDFVGTGRKSRKLLTATGISKSLGGKPLFGELDLLLSPGMKIGLLGANGSGKTSLLRVLSGDLASDTGEVKWADDAQKVTFEQGRSALDPSHTLSHALCPNGDTIKYRERSIHVAAWAKQFLFRIEQLEVPIGDLSGGEQARVRIAQLMQLPADLLFLDEPTNDLDIPALEVLEETLADFPGAIVLVSHDRELMDRICTEVIGLDGRGGASSYASVDQWLRAYERSLEEASKPAKVEKTEDKAAARRAARSAKPRKLSYREQQEWEQMEGKILEAEERVAECEATVNRLAGGSHVELNDACQSLEAAQSEVATLYARWEELEAKREQAAS